MVNTDSKYKKSQRGSYNNTRYRSSKPVEYRSFLRFLFSLSGKISRDLFVGLRSVLFVIWLVISITYSFMPEANRIIEIVFQTMTLVVSWLMIATGYKRAHALGISGFYSIIGTGFAKPFFEFNKQDGDYISENIKTPLKKLRKFGNFVNKNTLTKIAYLFVFYLLMFGSMMLITRKAGSNIFDILKLVGVCAVVNFTQLLLTKLKIFRHFYMQIVKVCVFFLYHIIIVSMIVVSVQRSCLYSCIELYKSIDTKQETLQKQMQKKVQKSAPMKTIKK